jgi:hypothetical protein
MLSGQCALLIRHNHDEVVAVAHICQWFEGVPDKTVKLVEVDVGKNLAG